jgi:hypothetical protein
VKGAEQATESGFGVVVVEGITAGIAGVKPVGGINVHWTSATFEVGVESVKERVTVIVWFGRTLTVGDDRDNDCPMLTPLKRRSKAKRAIKSLPPETDSLSLTQAYI